jgi:NADH:ubiquinone oxidoreductase subunit F (NADH-binding)/(2Fe-2S) ferredoxin/NAD-dependent dihydropyrimidine dehydrogenase PreA subunit
MNFDELRASARERLDKEAAAAKPIIRVGLATCGRAAGAEDVAAAFQESLAKHSISATIAEVGCLGLCYAEPMVEVIMPGKPGVVYAQVKPKIVDKIVEQHIGQGKLVEEFAMAVMGPSNGLPGFEELPMLKGQLRVATRNCGLTGLDDLDHYLALGGYEGLDRALKMAPEEVIKTVKDSGLRGRGGAGFPTGQKWEFCRGPQNFPKYLICNADEGDPGAFMDRAIMEGDPHSVIEGMLIGAWAIAGRQGPIEGYIYARAEYPLAIANLTRAIEQARKAGLLGKNILGSGFDFDLRLNRGAGAFVCGEETALIASIEGKPGVPRTRPPFPAVSGLFGKPTNINNVETFATIPVVLTKGAEWFQNVGVDKNRGTKSFSLVGKIKNTGLIEVPLGTTVRDVVFSIGGGILDDKAFKAVQTGGPSGGCIPESLLDLPLTYEGLMQAGTIMGSGGMIVMDNETCMVDVARYFLNFTTEESCGKCTPCREGTKRMSEIMERICAGEGREEDIETLERMGKAIASASLCGLGQTAPNPTLSTIRYFRHEYEAHIRDKKCPAGVCKPLIKYSINSATCTGCGACLRNCPVTAITGEKKQPHVVDLSKCVKCGACRESCKFNAVVIE